jgi:class 3 adenylate cyclase
MSAKTVTVALNAVCVAGLIIATVLAGILLKDSNDTVKLSSQTARLAQELRQSSDDLTRFIRTYTVTGNASYWGYFQQVIRIRNGELPLPDEPWRNYWDLLISDGGPPRGFGPPHALRDRMREAEFTAAELALLDEAQRQSDALIDLEDVASNAMQGRYRPENTAGLTDEEARAFSVSAPPNQTFAMNLVHGIPYHQWKGRIMRPLDDFAAMSAKRVEDAIAVSYRNNIILIGVLTVMLTLLIAVLAIYYGKVASDAQTQHLLSAVLPQRVVESISVGQFSELREIAAERARGIRRKKNKKAGANSAVAFEANESMRGGSSSVGGRGSHATGRSTTLSVNVASASMPIADFPVLYSEFLPTAWVAFTDVVSFTDMCRYTASYEVISILNELFSLIDVAAGKYKIEKIKTIGDSFMAAKLSVSEFDELDDDARQDRVAADGLAMVQFLLRACTLARSVARPADPTVAASTANPFLEMRVGLNVGPCASGIVGFERPLYDLFGDTVNAAARLEASGHVGRVHVLDSAVPHFGRHVQDLYFDGRNSEVVLKGLGACSTRTILGASSSAGHDADDSRSTASSARAASSVDSPASRRYRTTTDGSVEGSAEGSPAALGAVGSRGLLVESQEDPMSPGADPLPNAV